jgi:hypothetical protein
VAAALVVWLARASLAPADEPLPVVGDPPPPVASALVTPAPSLPIRESAARLVRQLDDDWKTPCGKKSQGIPCFPIRSDETRSKWTASVRDSLGDLGPAGKQSPDRPPTEGEMKAFRPGPVGPVGAGIGFDPGCVGKSLLKRIKGKNDTYYLYRVRDVHGERVALFDHRLEAASFQGALEYLGRFDGDCNALSAYRHEDRKTGVVEAAPPD